MSASKSTRNPSGCAVSVVDWVPDVQASRSVLKTLPVFTDSALAIPHGLLVILVNLGQGDQIDDGSSDGLD